MAVGKNKGLNKGGKKGLKKKVVDPFTRKNWYDVKVPTMFATRLIGKTPVNRTQGIKTESDFLKRRNFEVSLADLQNDSDAERSFRKFRFIAEYVQGRNVFTNFHGMDLTNDKLRSMVKKWQTLIEARVDARTVDGYVLRVFCIGFTNKDQMSQRKTCYAQQTQVCNIRKRMVEKITHDVTNSTLKSFVNMLLPDAIGKEIEAKCRSIFPLHDVYIRKVKVLKRPRFDENRLKEFYEEGNEGGEVVGEKIDSYEPPVQEAV